MIWCAMYPPYVIVHGVPVMSLSLLSYIAIVYNSKALITPRPGEVLLPQW